MRNSLVLFALGILGLVLSQGLGQAQTGKKGPLDLNAKAHFSDTWTKTNNAYNRFKLNTVPSPRDRVTIPKAYVSINLVYARRAANSNDDLVTLFVHNPSRKTVKNVSYTIHNDNLHNGKYYKLHASGLIKIKLGGNDISPDGEVPPGIHQMQIMIRGDNYTKYILNLWPSIEGHVVFYATRDATVLPVRNVRTKAAFRR